MVVVELIFVFVIAHHRGHSVRADNAGLIEGPRENEEGKVFHIPI